VRYIFDVMDLGIAVSFTVAGVYEAISVFKEKPDV
jgi:hypothetical protein